MNLDEIRIFQHLAETLHFGRAAQAVHLSPSALSRALARLEREVGTPLFARDRRTVRLTAGGERFREFARNALANWEQLREELGGRGNLRGEIAIYGSVTASCVVLPPLLESFQKTYPQVAVRLRTGDVESAIERVVAGDADVAVAVLPGKLPSGLRAVRVATTELEMVAPLTAGPVRDAITARRIDWNKVPFVAPDRGVGWQCASAWFRAKRIKPNIIARVAGGEAILGMAALGFGVGFVSRLILDSHSAGRQVERLVISPRLRPFEIALVARRSAPLASAFLDQWQERGKVQITD